MPCNGKQKLPQSADVKIYNKIEDNFHISNKKALYLNMKNYYEALEQDVFDYLPLTFHLKQGLEDPEFQKFKIKYNELSELQKKNNKNIWIIKPGENSNQGHGIQVSKQLKEIEEIITDSPSKTLILQKYI